MILTARQKEMLKIIVLEYIKSAKPVSSKLICKGLDCSSATVRNEMALLEDYGLLEKTHSSSGRIPSEEGYRYYVDNLMETKKISGEDMLKLQTIFRNNSLEISDCLSKSLELVSEMTNYTSIKLGNKSSDNHLKEVNVIPLGGDQLVAVVVTDRGHVEHKNLTILNLDLDEVKKTVTMINKMIVGTPIDEVSAKLEFEVKPIIANVIKEQELLYNAFYEVFNKFAETKTEVVGKNKILKIPEFRSNVDKVENILEKLDDEFLVDLVEEEGHEIKVYIGSESNIDEDVTVVKTTYKTPKEEGTIAIIGPKRMDYERVLNMLEYIKENIERIGDV